MSLPVSAPSKYCRSGIAYFSSVGAGVPPPPNSPSNPTTKGTMPSPLSRTVVAIDSAVLPPLLVVLALEVLLLLPLAACGASLLPWSSPSCFTVSLSEAAISSPLSSAPPGLESCCPDTATKVS